MSQSDKNYPSTPHLDYKDVWGTTDAKGLYNGNISWMSTDLPGLGSNRMQAMVYGYD